MNEKTIICASLILGLASAPLAAAPFAVPDVATQGKLAQILGKVAAPKAVLTGNRFTALQSLAASTTGTCTASLAAPGNGRKLWAIYMIGADLESDGGFATANMKQLVDGWNALAAKDDIDIVLAFGGAAKPGWQGIKYASIAQLAADMADGVLGNGGDYLYSDAAADMGKQATFEAFLNYVNGHYGQSGRKFLSFWNHGASYNSQPGIGSDENTRSVLDLTQINNGLASSRSCFNLIGFDACLMASMETAMALKDFGQYMVASEELEPGHGWNYSHVLNALASRPGTLDIGKAMVDSFVDSASHASVEDGKTLSVLDLGQVDGAVQALEPASAAIATAALGSDSPAVIRAFYTSQKYAGSLTVDPDVVPSQLSIDLKDFLSIVAARTQDNALKQQIAAATSAVDRLVAYSREDGTRPHSTGVAIAPLDMNPARANEQVGVGLINGGWGRLLQSYATLKQKAGAPLASALQTGVAGSGLSFISLRDGSQESGADQQNTLGITARFTSPYLAEVRGSYGVIDQDGGLIQLGEYPTALAADGSYYFSQWNGQGLALGSAGEYLVFPVFYTQVGSKGASFNSIVVIERPGRAAPLLGMMTIAPDQAGNPDYSIKLIQSNGVNAIISREDLQFQAGDTVTFYTTKLMPKGGSDVVPLPRHTFRATPKIFQTALTNGNYGYTLVGYSVGDLAGYAPIQPVSGADRVFNWSAATNPAFQLGGDSLAVAGYYARCNAAKSVCLGAKDDSLWFYDGKLLGDLGKLDDWLNQARSAGY